MDPLGGLGNDPLQQSMRLTVPHREMLQRRIAATYTTRMVSRRRLRSPGPRSRRRRSRPPTAARRFARFGKAPLTVAAVGSPVLEKRTSKLLVSKLSQ